MHKIINAAIHQPSMAMVNLKLKLLFFKFIEK